MKKLMFSLAVAGLCGAVFADVTSANIVGYQNIDSNPDMFTMMTSTFISMTNETGCSLAELAVTGYTPPTWTTKNEGGTKGDFTLKLLTKTGSAENGKTYYWCDFYKKVNNVPTLFRGWYASALGTEIPGGASSIWIKAGRGLWCTTTGLKLVSAGAVEAKSVDFITNPDNFTAAGNCTPVTLTLDKLSVKGYTPPVWTTKNEGGTKGDFTLKLLTKTGSAENGKTYYWCDFYKKVNNVPTLLRGWYASALGTEIPGGASSITITAGRGVWCTTTGLTLVIPPYTAATPESAE